MKVFHRKQADGSGLLVPREWPVHILHHQVTQALLMMAASVEIKTQLYTGYHMTPMDYHIISRIAREVYDVEAQKLLRRT